MPSVVNKNAVESIGKHGRGVRVEFEKLTDRYCQKIYVVDGEQAELALSSSEATPTDCSPVVPAFQDLNMENLNGRPFAALVGMSGSCHWSMTVEPIAEEGITGILFDAACRMKAALPRVTSGYKISAGAKTPHAEPTIEIATPLGSIKLEALQAEPEATNPIVAAYRDGLLSVHREVAPPDRLPATVRWRYRMMM